MPNAFRVSEACTIALHTMALLAEQPERSLTTHEIARTFGVSEAHLAKVLQRLHRAGLVDATRGPKGGHTLAKPPEAVTLMDVYRVMEGPLDETACLFQTPACDGTNCILGDLMEKVNREVREYLEGTRLADLHGVYDGILAKGAPHA